MQRCERCARVVPEDEPCCPECGPPSTRPGALRAAHPVRASDPPRAVLGRPMHGRPAHGQTALAADAPGQARALRAVADYAEIAGPHGAGDDARGHDAPVAPAQALAVATALEPKSAPFAQERTGAQRRESVEWARGGGEGAKIVPLRSTPPPPRDARREGAAHDDAAERANHDAAERTSHDAAERPQRDAAERASHDAGDTVGGAGALRVLPAEASRTGTGEPPHAQDAQPPASVATRSEPPPVRPRATPVPVEPRRPPVLASESLRADLAPNAPGRHTIRVTAITLGAAGAATAALVGGLDAGALTVAAALALIAAIGVAPLDYRRRAFALLAVAAPAQVSATVLAAPHGGVPHGGLLALTASGLAGALYFRAEYRASRLARALVAVGVVQGFVWLALSGGLQRLGVIGADWQSWLPALLGGALAPVLLLALLGFMKQDSTGGCGIWATSLLVWLACYESAAHAAQVFPADGGGPTQGWQVGAAMGAIAAPLLAPIAALAVAHLLVVASGGGREEPAPGATPSP